MVSCACAPTESVSEAQLEARAHAVLETAPPPAFPILRWGELQPLEAGDFRGRASFGQHGFLTMEHTMFDSIEGRWQLELDPDGEARACFSGRRRQGGSISRYASDDGRDQHNEYETEWKLGLAGRWERGSHRDGRGQVRFERLRYGDCIVGESASPVAEVLPWTCWVMQSPREYGGTAIACRLPLVSQPDAVRHAALAVRDTPRDGSWEMRELITRRGEPVFDDDARPWLVAGEVREEVGGVVVHSRDDGPRGGESRVALRLEAEDLTDLRAEE